MAADAIGETFDAGWAIGDGEVVANLRLPHAKQPSSLVKQGLSAGGTPAR
jgi:hypothetical protein